MHPSIHPPIHPCIYPPNDQSTHWYIIWSTHSHGCLWGYLNEYEETWSVRRNMKISGCAGVGGKHLTLMVLIFPQIASVPMECRISPTQNWATGNVSLVSTSGNRPLVKPPKAPVQFSSVQLLSPIQLFVVPWTIAHQASLSITNSWSFFKHVHWVGDAITISFSVIFFSSYFQSFPAAGSFPVSQFFASGGQSIEALASTLAKAPERPGNVSV